MFLTRIALASFIFLVLVSGSYAGDSLRISKSPLLEGFDTSACIPISKLPDGSIQRGLGEKRSIRQVAIHFYGQGVVDITVSLAKSYIDGNYSRPVLKECAHFSDYIDDDLLEFSCLDALSDGEVANPEGAAAYGIYAKLAGEWHNSQIAVCQVEISAKTQSRSRQEKVSTIVYVTCILCVMILGIVVGELAWYFYFRERAGNGQSDEDHLPLRTHKKVHRLSQSRTVDES